VRYIFKIPNEASKVTTYRVKLPSYCPFFSIQEELFHLNFYILTVYSAALPHAQTDRCVSLFFAFPVAVFK
jgi:hypothetical protein